MSNQVRIVGIATGRGAGDEGCQRGPDSLRARGLTAHLVRAGVPAQWHTTLRASRSLPPLEAVRQLSTLQAQQVYRLLRTGDFPLVLGGDHSCGIGTWSGAARALRPRGALGLVWIDAHMDAHVPSTSPTGNLHGMPLACLLGEGDQHLSALAGAQALRPEHLCLVGIRSFEDGEAALLARLGVRVIHADEVHRRGLAAALDEAIAIATRGTAGFGMSVDLDALDPTDAPGVGTPVPGGLSGEALLDAMSAWAGDSRLRALEIAEYNPLHDRDGRTAELAMRVAATVLAPRAAEHHPRAA